MIEINKYGGQPPSVTDQATSIAKDLYEIGEIPPLGHVPKHMYAWVIRRERHGDPESAMQVEVVDTPSTGSEDALVMIMATGIGYNSIFASLGTPVSPFDVHGHPYHICGGEAAGVVWAIGDRVTKWKIGDEVVLHSHQDDGDDIECNGGDPTLSPSQRIWGYETPDGSFAQFARVQARQLLARPTHLSWEESACYTGTLAPAYRMLFGHPPHGLRPGQNVLVWGAAGGLGSMAVQLVRVAGANAIGIVSDEFKQDYVMSLGAKGVINRKEFECWGRLPDINDIEYSDYMKEVRRFGRAIWEITGKGNDVDIAFEHPGEMTFPVSCYVVKRGGMVVFCGGTSGYHFTMDARFVWMRQKRIQGSHFASPYQVWEANRLVVERRIDPCLSEAFTWSELPRAHTKMWRNQHQPGNMAVLVQASTTHSASKR
ncbi:crotonyl-CoA carboxylase/reductase [Bradyrhizobium sp. CIR18]|uniref:crotonyl-CoA carboxylase/reductase n=1 Tax=Bradyrhizobium sp. CIR18 TaxID=2663839 RepID=UPI001605D3E1|nr:crotonyl-CoA carboxylase/reductase [Bradyrhizobium sp. CIR18]MBB4365273.1 crotonyl-CoA carboxylase/reductase [Bradyrhizobium sp. CIR18]